MNNFHLFLSALSGLMMLLMLMMLLLLMIVHCSDEEWGLRSVKRMIPSNQPPVSPCIVNSSSQIYSSSTLSDHLHTMISSDWWVLSCDLYHLCSATPMVLAASDLVCTTQHWGLVPNIAESLYASRLSCLVTHAAPTSHCLLSLILSPSQNAMSMKLTNQDISCVLLILSINWWLQHLMYLYKVASILCSTMCICELKNHPCIYIVWDFFNSWLDLFNCPVSVMTSSSTTSIWSQIFHVKRISCQIIPDLRNQYFWKSLETWFQYQFHHHLQNWIDHPE